MEKVYFGGNIVTMRYEGETVEAVLTEHGRIKAVGTLEEIESMAESDAERVNLKGRTMFPAFLDSHGHISMLAENLAKADLSQARNFDDIVRILTDFREKNQLFHGEYIQGFGYDQNQLAEGRHPDKFVLDKVSTENPIYISHISLHMGVANSAALKQAGITYESDMPAELIGRLSNGEPSGYLAETGMTAIYMQLARQPLDFPSLYQKAQEVYLKNGICTVQDGAVGKEQFAQLKRLAAAGVFKIDTAAYLMLPDSGHEIVQENKSMLHSYENHLKISGYKLVLDGSPQGKTAWLSEPYTDGTNGTAWMTNEQVEFFTKQSVDDGVQLIVHCNGDGACEQFLNSYEQAVELSNNPEKRKLRPVMIHSQTVRRDQLERFKNLGMMPSFFVDHVYRWGDVHLENLGKKRADNISPVGWAEDLDLPYTFHQDTPVLPPNMLRTVRTAVERITLAGVLLGENQRSSLYNALKAITVNAAYQYGEENDKGSIDENKYADFVILDKNPFQIPTQEITDIKIMETIFRDEILYKCGQRKLNDL